MTVPGVVFLVKSSTAPDASEDAAPVVVESRARIPLSVFLSLSLSLFPVSN